MTPDGAGDMQFRAGVIAGEGAWIASGRGVSVKEWGEGSASPREQPADLEDQRHGRRQLSGDALGRRAFLRPDDDTSWRLKLDVLATCDWPAARKWCAFFSGRARRAPGKCGWDLLQFL
jgi:hypothetical protein